MQGIGVEVGDGTLTVAKLSLYHCRIMFDRLPDLFDPIEFAEKKRRIRGRVPLSSLDRVRDVLLRLEGDAEVDLEFKREGRIPSLEGFVAAELTLQCQCCLEALTWPVRSEVHLGMVGSIDEVSILPEEFEPMLVEPGGMVALADIIQDELLLAMPSIPQHSRCRLSQPEATAESTDHPFAILAELKKKPS